MKPSLSRQNHRVKNVGVIFLYLRCIIHSNVVKYKKLQTPGFEGLSLLVNKIIIFSLEQPFSLALLLFLAAFFFGLLFFLPWQLLSLAAAFGALFLCLSSFLLLLFFSLCFSALSALSVAAAVLSWFWRFFYLLASSLLLLPEVQISLISTLFFFSTSNHFTIFFRSLAYTLSKSSSGYTFSKYFFSTALSLPSGNDYHRLFPWREKYQQGLHYHGRYILQYFPGEKSCEYAMKRNVCTVIIQ